MGEQMHKFRCFYSRRDADLNLQNRDGDTPMHLAIWSKNTNLNRLYYDDEYFRDRIRSLSNRAGETLLSLQQRVEYLDQLDELAAKKDQDAQELARIQARTRRRMT